MCHWDLWGSDGTPATAQMMDTATGQPLPYGQWEITLAPQSSPSSNSACGITVTIENNSGTGTLVGSVSACAQPGTTWAATQVTPLAFGSAVYSGYTVGAPVQATSNAVTFVNSFTPVYTVTISPTTLPGNVKLPASAMSVSIKDSTGNTPPDGIYELWWGPPSTIGSNSWTIVVTNGEIAIPYRYNTSLGSAQPLYYPAGVWAAGGNVGWPVLTMQSSVNPSTFGWGFLSPGAYQVYFVTPPNGQTAPATSNSFQVANAAAGGSTGSSGTGRTGTGNSGTGNSGTGNSGTGGSATAGGGTSSRPSGAMTLQQILNALSQRLIQLSQTNPALYTQAIAILNQLVSLLGGSSSGSPGSNAPVAPANPSPTPTTPSTAHNVNIAFSSSQIENVSLGPLGLDGTPATVQMTDTATGQPLPSGQWEITLAPQSSPSSNSACGILVTVEGSSGTGWLAGTLPSACVQQGTTWAATQVTPLAFGSAVYSGYTVGAPVQATSNAVTFVSSFAPAYTVTVSPTTLPGNVRLPASAMSVSIKDSTGNTPPDGIYELWFGAPSTIGSNSWTIVVTNGEIAIPYRTASSGQPLYYPAGVWAAGGNVGWPVLTMQSGVNPSTFGWGFLSPGAYQVYFVTPPNGQTAPATSNSFQVANAAAAGQNLPPSTTTGASAVSASLNANGQTSLSSVPIGTAITYSWNSQGGSQFSSALAIYNSSGAAVSADPCGYKSTNSWVINGANGTFAGGTIASCQAGYDYVITYTVTSASGAVATASVNIAVAASGAVITVATTSKPVVCPAWGCGLPSPIF